MSFLESQARSAEVTLPASYASEFNEPVGFLNFAGLGPPSRRVVEATISFLRYLQEPDAPAALRFDEVLEAGRRRVASFLGVGFDSAGLAFSTGDALFQVAMGMRGGNVVVPAAEFPANLLPVDPGARGGASRRGAVARGSRRSSDARPGGRAR